MPVIVREVDGSDDDVADNLKELHLLTFGPKTEVPDFGLGFWWLAFDPAKRPYEAVGFAGLTRVPHTHFGYLKRSGVLPSHRGNRLQQRFIRARELKARKQGWVKVLTDTTDNIPSANNMIRAGYLLYTPQDPWAFQNSLYWYKDLNGHP